MSDSYMAKFVFINILTKSYALETSQLPISWLNADAPLNMPYCAQK